MTSAKYIGMDVHKESISIAVMNSIGKLVMEPGSFGNTQVKKGLGSQGRFVSDV
jgi:hypothetical protein